MRGIIILLCGMCSIGTSFAQSDSEAIQLVIEQLFDGMRANDSMMVKELFVDGATLSSVHQNRENKIVKSSTPAGGFITAVGTPRDEVWNEVIWSYDIKVDGPMGFAWTDYTFYRGEIMSHCGVNAVEMIKSAEGWKISGITDTRRRNGCKTLSGQQVNDLMDAWHHAAATADEDVFFGSMTEDAVYIGTDPTERWPKKEFMSWSQQYFERDVAWAFTPISRNVTFDANEQIGWFDELLDSWMGLVRGSGVVTKTADGWKINHYHLAIAVPNGVTPDYLKLIGKEAPNRDK